MESSLASAAVITDQRQKIEQYKLILASVLSSSPIGISQAKCFIDHSNLSLLIPFSKKPRVRVFAILQKVEAVKHFEDDTEELQQWDQQME